MDIMMELSHSCRVKDHVWNTPGYRPREGEATHQWEFQVRYQAWFFFTMKKEKNKGEGKKNTCRFEIVTPTG